MILLPVRTTMRQQIVRVWIKENLTSRKFGNNGMFLQPWDITKLP